VLQTWEVTLCKSLHEDVHWELPDPNPWGVSRENFPKISAKLPWLQMDFISNSIPQRLFPGSGNSNFGTHQ